MSLPKKAEKGYLQVSHSADGLSVAGLPEHVQELEPLFTQHGLPCQRGQATPDGLETLRFEPGADAAKVAEVLEAYKAAKGS
jgi:hypothetical protein